MTQLILVRHGQTDWNREGRYQGQANPPLNTLGREQAEAIAEQLAGQSLNAIYSSDLQRALETARIIAGRLGLKVQLDPRLREIDQGEWEGMVASDISVRYPTEWETRQRDPLHARPPKGETVTEVATRVWSAIDDISSRHPAGRILIVSHALALATLLCRASNCSLDHVYHLAPANGYLETIPWP
jgi:alpha-ribazole phosphatase